MTEKILYKAGKPERGTTFEIYTDGTIKIKRKLTLASLHIPVRILNWMDIVRSSKENKNSIRVTIIVNDHNRNNEIISNQIATLEKKKDEWFLELSNNNEIKMRIAQYRSSKVTCIIYGLKPAKLFYKNKELLKHNSVKEEKNIQWLLGSKRRGSSFNIYQTNTKQLQIECYCSLGESGDIELSQELGRYIKDWWTLKNNYVVGTIDDGSKTILKFSQRKKKKQLVNKITIPYYGPRKKIKIIFTHPIFELSKHAKQDLTLTKELRQAGYNIQQLTTAWTDKSRHVDKDFESNVWTILKSVFTEENSKLFSETKITTSNRPQITKRLDGLLIWNELIGLIEIKTAEKNNEPLTEILGELLYLQDEIKKSNICSIVFLNFEVTTTEFGKNITKLYGLAKKIILIGRDEVNALVKKPTLFLERINEFLTLLKDNKRMNQLIHPVTHKLTTKKDLEQEAFKVLRQTHTKPAKAKQLIEQYCFLMNTTKTDYSLLYKVISDRLNNSADFDMRLQKKFSVFQPIDNVEEILQTLHSTLAKNGNYHILKARSKMFYNRREYQILLEQWEIISNNLPPLCNIIKFKRFKTESGTEYEKHTRELLERMDFQVVSNVLFSFYGKHFEVDHLIFKNGEMQAISCKDRGEFQYEPNLYSKIRFAIGEINLHQKTINCNKSQLYIKVKDDFLPNIDSMFHDYRTETFALEITK